MLKMWKSAEVDSSITHNQGSTIILLGDGDNPAVKQPQGE